MTYQIFELLDCLAMSLDEGNRDGEGGGVNSDTLDGARGISCFGKSVTDCFAEFLVGRKVDMFAPSDVVGVDEKSLEFDLFLIVDVSEKHRS